MIIPAAALDWTAETVDGTGDVGQYTSLALDNSSRPRISYMDWSNYYLKYASQNEGVWIIETVDQTHGTGEYTSLELGVSAQPLVSYYDVNQGNLSFATKTGETWTTVTVDSGGVGRYTSLSLDSSGNPRIAYQDLSNMKLKYAEWNSGAWTNETVDNSVNVGAYTSLALDSAGNPGISYYDAAHGFLKYASRSGGLWTTTTIDTTGNAGYYTSLAFDPAGNPAISYYDKLTRDLKFASKTGGVWKKEIVDSTGDVGQYTSLSLDGSGNPHISYYDATNGHLKYALKTGPAWTNETADTGLNVGLYTSLALDGMGNPRISYRDGTHGDLKYAAGIPPFTINFTASPLNGTAPLSVQFSETSTGGSPSCWNWSFGDGSWFNTSTAARREPSHVYESPGVYDVLLIMQNNPVPAELYRQEYITAEAAPSTTEPTTLPTSLPTTGEPTPPPSPTPTFPPTPDLTVSPTPDTTPPPTPTSPPTPDPTISPIPDTTPPPTPEPEPSPTTTTIPSVLPSAVEIQESDDDPPGLLPIRRDAGLLECRTVQVGGDSAIRSVTVTGQDISDIIISSRQVILPAVPMGAEMRVFQYIELIPVHYGSITAAGIDFDVPPVFIENNCASPFEIRLCILRDRSWVCLPTRSLGVRNGMERYRTDSPEFLMSAIALVKETPVRQEDTTPIVPAENTLANDESERSDVPYRSHIAGPYGPVEPDTRNSPVPGIISSAGLCGLGTGAVIAWRRQNNR